MKKIALVLLFITINTFSQRSNNYNYEVAFGTVNGAATVNKFGLNSDIDSVEELVASYGGVFDPTTDIITTAQTFTIAYNNVTDGSGTTGATQLLFTYIDENNKEINAIHVLGSSGSDVTAFTGLGINRCLVYANGGDGFNANNITITATTDATTQSQIPAELSVTQQCIFFTPIGKKFVLDFIRFNALKLSGSSPKITLRLYSYSKFTGTRYLFFTDEIDTSVHNNVEIIFKTPYLIQGREVVYMTIESTANDTNASAGFSGIIR